MTQSDVRCAKEFLKVKPTAADQLREPDLDLIAIWRDDVDQSIRCRDLDEDRAAAFREAVGY